MLNVCYAKSLMKLKSTSSWIVSSPKEWHRLLQWTQSRPINAEGCHQYNQDIINRSKGKSQPAQIFKLVYTEFIHSIWIERNMRIFEKVHRSSEAIAREISCICSVSSC